MFLTEGKKTYGRRECREALADLMRLRHTAVFDRAPAPQVFDFSKEKQRHEVPVALLI